MSHVINMLDMLENRTSRAWNMLDTLEDRANRTWKSFVVYIDLERDLLKRSCSTHFNYFVIAFIVEAYVILYWFSYDCLWQISSLEQTQVLLWLKRKSDLTTLNILKMFTSRQRNFAFNIINVTTSRINNHFDN